jgi:flagellar motor protein MotB
VKLFGIVGTAVLSMTLGVAAPVYAQEDRSQQDDHAQQDDKKAPPDKPAQQEEKKAQQEEKKPEQAKPAQEDKKAQQEEKKPQQEKPAAQHEEQAQHGRIPEDRFRANFGREHVFVINRPVIVGGQPRFQYGGYWFGFNQAWPSGWLYTDNVYVDYVDGGYFLFNPFHPGIRVVIVVI